MCPGPFLTSSADTVHQGVPLCSQLLLTPRSCHSKICLCERRSDVGHLHSVRPYQSAHGCRRWRRAPPRRPARQSLQRPWTHFSDAGRGPPVREFPRSRLGRARPARRPAARPAGSAPHQCPRPVDKINPCYITSSCTRLNNARPLVLGFKGEACSAAAACAQPTLRQTCGL